MYDEFVALDTVVVALSQEDQSLEPYGPFLARFGDDGPRFEIVCDLGREETPAYDRTTAYLIDKAGRVREIFPMIIHARPSWKIVLREVLELRAAQEGGRAPEAGSGS